jgi:methionyl-tRNA synthetase
LAKDDARRAELDRVLYATAESLRALAILLHATMPETTEKLWESLGANESMGALADQRIASAGVWGGLPAGTHVVKGEVLFPRLLEE